MTLPIVSSITSLEGRKLRFHYPPMTMAERIKFLRDREKLSQAKFGAKFGVTREAVSQWEKGGNIDPARLLLISKEYSVSLGWLAAQEPLVETPKEEHPPNTVAPRNAGAVRLVEGAQADFRTWPKDLKILGFVKAGLVGFFPDNGEALDVTFRPPALVGVNGAYAVIVSDDSMVPAFKPGRVIWVHPWRRADPGDDIIIQTKDGQAFIKELVRRAGKQIICKQWNPVQELRFDEDKVTIHLVVGTSRDP